MPVLEPRARVPWWMAVMLIFQFNTSSSLILYPYAAGRLGYLGTVVAMAFYWSFAIFGEILITRAALRHPEAKTLGDLGDALGGQRWRAALETFQMANMWLWLPVATIFMADSTRNVVVQLGWGEGETTDAYGFLPEGLDCHLVWIAMILALELCVVQLFEHYRGCGWLAFITTGMVATKIALFALDGVVTRQENGPLATEAKARLFGSPNASSWVEIFNALVVLVYSFCPVFVHVEIMDETVEGDRAKYNQALGIATAMMASAYLLGGYVCIALGGWDTTYPITQPPSKPGEFGLSFEPSSITVNVFVIAATLLDYVIAHVAISKTLLRRNPHVNKDGSCTILQNEIDSFFARRFRWFAWSLPPWILNAALALSIPVFSTLVSLLTGLVIPTAQIVLPALLALLVHVRGEKRVEEEDDDRKENGMAPSSSASSEPTSGGRTTSDVAYRVILGLSIAVGIAFSAIGIVRKLPTAAAPPSTMTFSSYSSWSCGSSNRPSSHTRYRRLPQAGSHTCAL